MGISFTFLGKAPFYWGNFKVIGVLLGFPNSSWIDWRNWKAIQITG